MLWVCGNDEYVLYSAEDYSSIYVSKSDFNSIEKLRKELDNDQRYSMRHTKGSRIRERFVPKVICLDCNNNVCNPGPMPLWHHKPLEIKCNICGFVYNP
jgi:hypothetical protein